MPSDVLLTKAETFGDPLAAARILIDQRDTPSAGGYPAVHFT